MFAEALSLVVAEGTQEYLSSSECIFLLSRKRATVGGYFSYANA